MRGWLYFFLFSLRHGYTLYYTIPNGRRANDQKIKIYIHSAVLRPETDNTRELPLAGLADPFGDVWRRALDEEVEHHGGGSGETVPVGVIWGGCAIWQREGRGTYQVTMYCIWLFWIFTSAALAIGMPPARFPMATMKSGSIDLSSGEEEEEEGEEAEGEVHAPVVSSIHTGCAPTSFAMPSTSGK